MLYLEGEAMRIVWLVLVSLASVGWVGVSGALIELDSLAGILLQRSCGLSVILVTFMIFGCLR